MCGIAGLVATRTRSVDDVKRTVALAVDELHHRGPDGRGVWAEADLPVALGHTRLAVVDLSEAGSQPMASATGRYVITYNGEIYNAPEIASGLVDFRPRGHSDTEVLLAAIEAWGLDKAIEAANGMFAMAVWDRQNQELTLVRDRFGQKPLFFGVVGDRLVFASELQAIEAMAGPDLDLDLDSIAGFLGDGTISDCRSMYRQIKKVPPGHSVRTTSDLTGFEAPEQYWSARDIAECSAVSVGKDDAADVVEEALLDAVAIRLRSDVPVGVFLSGGVDSTVIAALAQKARADQIRTFTVKTVDDHALDESPYAAKAAEHLGTEHIELPVSASDAIELVPQLGRLLDEPLGDPSQIPTYLIAKRARAQVTVALGGDGGDEMFAGYNRHVWLGTFSKTAQAIPRPARRVTAAALRAPSPNAVNRAVGMLPRSLRLHEPVNKRDKIAALLDLNHQATASDVTVLWDPPPMLGSGLVAPSVDRPTSSSLGPLRALLLDDIERAMPDRFLVKVDRATMASSLEARSPFLDHRIWPLSCSLGDDTLVEGRRGKQVLRRIAQKYVPAEVFERPKAGFAVPLGSWLRGELAEWAGDLLSANEIERHGVLDPHPVAALWAAHTEGTVDAHQQLFAALMLQSWLSHRATRS